MRYITGMSKLPGIDNASKRKPNHKSMDMLANMQAILNHSTECYVLASLDGTIRMINPSARAMILSNEGAEAKEGSNFYSFFDPVRLPVFLGYIDEVGKGNTISYSRELKRIDGSCIWVEFLLTPVIEEENI